MVEAAVSEAEAKGRTKTDEEVPAFRWLGVPGSASSPREAVMLLRLSARFDPRRDAAPWLAGQPLASASASAGEGGVRAAKRLTLEACRALPLGAPLVAVSLRPPNCETAEENFGGQSASKAGVGLGPETQGEPVAEGPRSVLGFPIRNVR